MSRPQYIFRPETAFSVSRQRRPRDKNDNHLKFIRGLSCVCCGTRSQIEAAHVRMASRIHAKPESGIGAKPDDRWTVPLCASCHRLGPESQHEVGEVKFWEKLGIDPFELCLTLWGLTGQDDAAELVLRLRRERR